VNVDSSSTTSSRRSNIGLNQVRGRSRQNDGPVLPDTSRSYSSKAKGPNGSHRGNGNAAVCIGIAVGLVVGALFCFAVAHKSPNSDSIAVPEDTAALVQEAPTATGKDSDQLHQRLANVMSRRGGSHSQKGVRGGASRWDSKVGPNAIRRRRSPALSPWQRRAQAAINRLRKKIRRGVSVAGRYAGKYAKVAKTKLKRTNLALMKRGLGRWESLTSAIGTRRRRTIARHGRVGRWDVKDTTSRRRRTMRATQNEQEMSVTLPNDATSKLGRLKTNVRNRLSRGAQRLKKKMKDLQAMLTASKKPKPGRWDTKLGSISARRRRSEPTKSEKPSIKKNKKHTIARRRRSEPTNNKQPSIKKNKKHTIARKSAKLSSSTAKRPSRNAEDPSLDEEPHLAPDTEEPPPSWD